MENGNHFGWTHETVLSIVAVSFLSIIMWVRTAREGDSKAVDVALVGSTKAQGKASDDTDRQFDAMREQIAELAKTVNQGLSGFQSAMKLLAGLTVIAVLGSMAYSIVSG